MPDFIRVRDNQTGHHVSILQAQYNANPDGWSVLKQDATYPDGTPLPPKFKTDVSSEAAKKSGGQTPAGDKE